MMLERTDGKPRRRGGWGGEEERQREGEGEEERRITEILESS
jgi:hypothetical protein